MTAARTVVRSPVSIVWLGLVVLTLVAWWLGTEHGLAGPTAAGIAVLVVAFVKARFVALYFMEVRGAPAALRIGVEAWCGIVCVALVAIFLLS